MFRGTAVYSVKGKIFSTCHIENVALRLTAEGHVFVFLTAYLEALGKEEGITILPANTFTNIILMLNTKSEPCSNTDFRKALTYAFPYEETAGRNP